MIKNSGLIQVFLLSVVLGISIFFVYSYRGNFTQLGFSFIILDYISQFIPLDAQGLIVFFSLVVTIFSIYGLVKFFRKILESKINGIVTAMLGFSGSIGFLFVLQPFPF